MGHKQSAGRSIRAFTLIELLVVIAIVGLLVALLVFAAYGLEVGSLPLGETRSPPVPAPG